MKVGEPAAAEGARGGEKKGTRDEPTNSNGAGLRNRADTDLLGVRECAEEAGDGEDGLVEAEDDPVAPGEGGGGPVIVEARWHKMSAGTVLALRADGKSGRACG